jgi:hypothetical protein
LIPSDFALPFTSGALEPFLNSAILGFWEENLMSKRWTTEEILKLKTMAQKYPAAKIAEELGRGTSAVFVKAHELQVSLRLKGSLDPGSAGMELTG